MRLIKFIAISLGLVASLTSQAGGMSKDIQRLRDLLQPITSLSANFEQQINDANGIEIQASTGLSLIHI